MPARDRGGSLNRVAEVLQGRGEEIARTITQENGKPLRKAAAEVAMSVDHLRWFAGEAGLAYGRVVPNQVAGKRHLVLRVAVGVVAAILPGISPSPCPCGRSLRPWRRAAQSYTSRRRSLRCVRCNLPRRWTRPAFRRASSRW